jgi:hypothetical protein
MSAMKKFKDWSGHIPRATCPTDGFHTGLMIPIYRLRGYGDRGIADQHNDSNAIA